VTDETLVEHRFNEFLQLGGAEMRLLTSDYEIARFKTVNGVCVVYRNKKGKFSFSNAFARAAWEAFLSGKKWHAAKVFIRTARVKVENKLLRRDGNDCLYCGATFNEEKSPTLEHLLSIADGGNNHISNLALCCEPCNMEAASLPIVEKIKLRDAKRQSVKPDGD
jgi:hypothetical protein